MKVLVITDNSFLCEKTMYLDELKKGMEARGCRVDLLPIMQSSWSATEGKIPLKRLLRTMKAIPTVRKYDAIHVQFTFPIGSLLSLFKHLHGKPVIIHTHGDDVFSIQSAGIGFRRTLFGRLATKASWNATTQIIAVCKRAKAEIARSGVPEAKINTVYNGVNENLFCPKKRNLEENEYLKTKEGSDFVFLNVGSLKEVKNQARLISAFSLFAKGRNASSKLLVCGAGHLDKQLKSLARKLGVEDKVVFLGKVPHIMMPQLYSAVDAYVLPSLHEAHPWSLLEAMSCELPVAASNVGGIPETVNNEQLLINPWKIYEIRDAMAYLAENTKRSKSIGKNNREIVLTKFTMERHVDKLKSIYAKVIAK